MTESDWLTSTDPQAMLAFLRDSGRASERKLRLFAVACCRRIWPLLTDAKSQRAVKVAEQYADGHSTREQLQAAERTAGLAAGLGDSAASAAVCCTICEDGDAYDFANVPYFLVGRVLNHATDAATSIHTSYSSALAARKAERTAQAALLRDILGNPFHPLPTLAPFLLTREITALVSVAYDKRRLPQGTLDPGLCAAVADALEDAREAPGCCDATLPMGRWQLVEHLRSEGPHVRRCWALDLLLNRV